MDLILSNFITLVLGQWAVNCCASEKLFKVSGFGEGKIHSGAVKQSHKLLEKWNKYYK